MFQALGYSYRQSGCLFLCLKQQSTLSRCGYTTNCRFHQSLPRLICISALRMRLLSTSSALQSGHKSKVPPDTRVVLYGESHKLIGEMTKHEADQYASQTKAWLRYADKGEGNLPVYILHPADKPAQSDKQARKKEDEKKIEIGTKITEHDLEIKVNKIREWMIKGKSTTVVINYARNAKDKTVMGIYQGILDAIGDAATVKQGNPSKKSMIFSLTPHELTDEQKQKLKPIKHKAHT